MYKKVALALAVVFVLCSGLLASGQAYAKSGRITRGDAEAVLTAFITGGRAVWLTAGHQKGSVVDEFGGQEAIRPFAGSSYDGAHYCVDDWHVILLGLFEGGDRSFNKQDAVKLLASQNITFILDGDALLDTKRTPVKRFLNPEAFGWDTAYGFQEGQILSPDELSVGTHTLGAIVSDNTGILFVLDPITFYVDLSDSAACND